MEKKIQELNKSLEEQNIRLQEYRSKEKNWKDEMERLDQEIKHLEQEKGAGEERNGAIDSLEQELKELQLRLDYLKNSFVQFAKHKEKQDSLLPVIATLLQVPLEDFSPLAATSANQEHAGILSGMFGSNSTTIQPNGGSSSGFWPLW
jgi:predicted RNase H-like nuclease (RuvC/YqgF family)